MATSSKSQPTIRTNLLYQETLGYEIYSLFMLNLIPIFLYNNSTLIRRKNYKRFSCLVPCSTRISLYDFVFLNPPINENCTSLFVEKSYYVQAVGDSKLIFDILFF